MKIKLKHALLEADPDEILQIDRYNSRYPTPLGLLPIGIRYVTSQFMLLECSPRWVHVSARDGWRLGGGLEKEYTIYMPWHYIGMTSGKSMYLWVRPNAILENANFSTLSLGVPPLGNLYDDGQVCMHTIPGKSNEWLFEAAHSIWERGFNVDITDALRKGAWLRKPFAFAQDPRYGIHEALERWSALDEAAVMALKWPRVPTARLAVIAQVSIGGFVQYSTGAHRPPKTSREVSHD